MKKLVLLIFILIINQSFSQVYINNWGLGFGVLYPRYIAADVIPTDMSLGGFLSLQHEFSEHVGIRIKGLYMDINSEKPKITTSVAGGGIDMVYTFVPCEQLSPYMGFGFTGFSFTLKDAVLAANKSYLAYQMNILGGVYWNILGDGGKMKTEIGYHTVSEDKFDGVPGGGGGLLGGNQDAYMSFELGFIFYFSTDEESRFCDIYRGIPKYEPTKVDYDKIENIVKQYSETPLSLDYDRIEDIVRKYSQGNIEIKNNWVLIGVNFESNKSSLSPEAYPILVNAVQVLLSNPDLEVEVQGHTDNVGNKDYNRKLSIERAETVKRFLISKGINPSRLTVVGYGDSQPISDNKTPQGKALNRRIEFKIKN